MNQPRAGAKLKHASTISSLEETCQWPETADGDGSDKEADISNRHVLMQSAHIILEVAADDNNDCTGAEEEQGFEHSMSEEVEHAGHISKTTLTLE